MRSTLEIYVPRQGDGVPSGDADVSWPPPVYVPSGPSSDSSLGGRLRARLTRGRDTIGPETLARRLPSVFRDPELVEAVQERLAREFRARSAEAVAALEPGGYLAGATLAARAGRPLLAFREASRRTEGQGDRADLPAGRRPVELAEEGVEPGTRVLLVSGLLSTGDRLRTAAEQLEEAGARTVGIAVLVEVTDDVADDLHDDYNILSMLTLS